MDKGDKKCKHMTWRGNIKEDRTALITIIEAAMQGIYITNMGNASNGMMKWQQYRKEIKRSQHGQVSILPTQKKKF